MYVFLSGYHSIQHWLRFVLIIALIFPVIAMPQRTAAADAFDALRDRWEFLLTGKDTYDPADPIFANTLNRLTPVAQSFWDSLDKSPTRTALWSDLAGTTRSSDISNTYGRLRLMARMYAAHGSSLQGNVELRADLLSALDWMYTHRYNESKNQYDNWFEWEIGTPLHLNSLMVLLYDDLSAAQITNYTNAIKHFMRDPRYRTVGGSAETGANLVWKSTVAAVQGIINKDAARVSQARDALSPVFDYVASGDGFYTDGSFIQHENHPYTGGYGKSLLVELSNVLYLLNGSAWEVTDPDAQNVYRWVYDSFEPLIYNGAMMDMVRGREIARVADQDHAAGIQVMQAIIRLAQAAPAADALLLKRMVKGWIAADSFYDFFNYAAMPMLVLGKQIVEDGSITPRGELVAHRQFPNMDRIVHLRPGFGFGLSMSSQRIANYESINGEHLRGWYTADGATFLYNADQGQFSDDFWATVNAYRLPGTTVDTLPRGDTSINYGQDYRSPKTWVGGAQLNGLYGVAGMDLKASGDLNANGTVKTASSLTAKKAWFMFDDEVVALGAGISSIDNRVIETVVENRKLNAAGDNALTVNGVAKPNTPGWSETTTNARWAHLDDTGGYYFPSPTSVRGMREARTGAWRNINTSGSTTPITRNYLNLWFGHGSNPTNASYAYVLLPNKSAADTERYSASPQIKVIKNTAAVQAVRETSKGLFGVTFWQMGTAEYLKAFAPAAVMVQEESSALTIAVSDPTQQQSKLTFEVAKAGVSVVSQDPSITVTQLTPTIKFEVNVAQARGRTHTVKLTFDPAAATSKPTIHKLAPVADAFVRGGVYGSTNYGSDPTLVVSNAGGDYTRQAFLRFDLSNVSGEIDSAQLGLYGRVTDNNGTTKDNRIAAVDNDGWTESGITYNTKPANGAVLATETFDNTARWHEIDVTRYIGEQYERDRSASLTMFQDGTGLFTNINSQQNTSNRPYLNVTTYPFTPAQLAAVNLSTTATALKPGETSQLAVSGTLDDGKPANLSTATMRYRSDNPAVATVDQGGKVTAISYGKAIITVDVTLQGVVKSGSVQLPVAAWGPLTINVPTTADAYVRGGSYGDTNYGTETILAVSNAGGDFTRQSYLKFDLNALDGEVVSAQLVINAAVSDAKGTSKEQRIYGVADDAWTERGVTYNNHPAFGGLLASGTINNTFAWREFDVTAFVRAQQEGDKLATLAVAQDGTGLFTNINSKENNSNRPYLKITTYVYVEPDTTPPSVTCDAPASDWSANDVLVTCRASDTGSGLRDAADAEFTLRTNVPVGTETANAQTNTRQVCDQRNNCATVGPISGNKVDKQAPSVTIDIIISPSGIGTYKVA